MKIDEIVQLIDAINKSNVTKFKYSDETNTVEFEINKANNVCASNQVLVNSVPVEVAPSMISDNNKSEVLGKVIKSPIVGTFYTARKEGAEPLIQVGDTVKKGQVIGIIEAMKLMNEIEATEDGTVEEILVNNNELVEYNQPLVRLK